MDEINHIKYLRDKKGQTLRGIARETGHTFETVKKYAEKQEFNIIGHKQKRKSKLDPYKEIINEWLENDLKEKPKQRHTAKRVYDRLQEMLGSNLRYPSGRLDIMYRPRKKNSMARMIVLSHLIIPLGKLKLILEKPTLLKMEKDLPDCI